MAGHHSSSCVARAIVLGLLSAGFAACGTSREDSPAAASTDTMTQGSGGAAPSPTGNLPGNANTPGDTPPMTSPSPADEGVTPNPGLANEGVAPSGLSGGGTPPAQPPNEVPTAGSGASGPCLASATVKAGDATKTITVGGVQRTFLIHAPPRYDGTTRLPVVFDFHGLGGNSNQQKNLSRWDRVGDAQGFITVYPQGIDNAWNAGLCCSDGSDDVAFVRAIIESLGSDACIDSKRIFASGCSNGGGMSYKLACEAADVIAAVAPVDFDCVDGAGCNACDPARPITVVQFRGTNDQLVPYAGNAGAFAGAQANLATWGDINMCTGSPAALPQSAGCEGFPACGAGAQTVLCTVQNGTHCGNYGSFDIANVAWRVLQGQALP